jgi:ABC-type Fe3+/spermidine/putrescine transport system ATPase subunit
MSTPMVQAEGVHKRFGRLEVLQGINLEVQRGEVMCLLGPSGSGKSTFLRCINHLEKINSGRLSVDGELVGYREAGDKLHELHERDVARKRSEIGMVFQHFDLFPHMTALENVTLAPMRVKGVKRSTARTRAEALLDQVGLSDKANVYPVALSGGQQQRVALARALVREPEILLLDEPLSNLDARLRDRLRIQLREIQMQLAITAVYVTHDQNEALALADEIVVLRAGTVLQRGEPIELYGRPATSAVAEFLGYSNIFTATVTARDGMVADVAFEAGNDSIRGTLAASHNAAAVAACVRPNDVHIAALPSTGDALAPNAFSAEVVLASFEGTHIHYQARCASGIVWDVVCPDVSRALRVGTSASLSIAPEAVLLLPRDDA